MIPCYIPHHIWLYNWWHIFIIWFIWNYCWSCEISIFTNQRDLPYSHCCSSYPYVFKWKESNSTYMLGPTDKRSITRAQWKKYFSDSVIVVNIWRTKSVFRWETGVPSLVPHRLTNIGSDLSVIEVNLNRWIKEELKR